MPWPDWGGGRAEFGPFGSATGYDPKISPSRGGPVSLSNTMLLGTTRVSLPNGISFRPTALAGYTSVTDDLHTHTYRQTDHAR